MGLSHQKDLVSKEIPFQPLGLVDNHLASFLYLGVPGFSILECATYIVNRLLTPVIIFLVLGEWENDS